MKKQDIKFDINILLEKNSLDKAIIISSKYTQVDLASDNRYTNVHGSPEDFTIENQELESLKKLFFQNNKKIQKDIIDFLLEKLTNNSFSRLATIILMELGQFEKLTSTLAKHFDSYNSGYHFSLIAINNYLYFRWAKITNSQLLIFRKWTDDTIKSNNSIGAIINSRPDMHSELIATVKRIHMQTTHVLAEGVKTRILSGSNPEINQDKEELKKEIIRFGFPKDLSEAMDKIDSMFLVANDAFDFNGCMGLIRAFTERLYESILKSYGSEGLKVDEKKSEEVAKFFRKKNLISEGFAEMIIALRHFLSNEAVHRLKSRTEDARLTKNMVIEMSLYLLRRLENN